MEPLELAAIGTWAIIKIGEGTLAKIGENLLEAANNLRQRLQAKQPQLAAAIEGANEQPMDYGEAVLELKAAVQENPEIREAVEQVATEAQAHPESAVEIEKIRKHLQSQSPTIQNLAKLAEKIGVVNQGTINTQTNNFNI